MHILYQVVHFYVVFSDEDSHNSSEQEEYIHSYGGTSPRKSVYEDDYYVNGDEVIELHKQLSQDRHKSLRGSRSMDDILYTM